MYTSVFLVVSCTLRGPDDIYLFLEYGLLSLSEFVRVGQPQEREGVFR